MVTFAHRPGGRAFSTATPALGILLGLLAAVMAPPAALAQQAGFQQKLLQQTRRAEYDADVPKSIIALQMFREVRSAPLKDGGEVTLTALNPRINAWFLISLTDADGRSGGVFHIENPAPRKQTVTLETQPKAHLAISGPTGTFRCIPWSGRKPSLVRARDSRLPFAPICGGRLFLRNPVRGSRTTLEATAEFLRDNVWLGDSLVGLVKGTLFRDSKMETAKVVESGAKGMVPEGLVAADLERRPVILAGTALELEGAPDRRIVMGSWYPLKGVPGVYFTAIQPSLINREILRARDTANRLDPVEGEALAYMVAFDMSRFDIGYEVGTEHPRLGWSSRPSGAGRNPRLPGPDGFDRPAPIVNVGMVSPALTSRLVATFTGGFKRDHGAWRFGPWAYTDYGKHYGFLVHGVLESKLKTELATFYVLDDGSIGMKTWTAADEQTLLPRLRFARQNGVPLVERDPETGRPVPGRLVNNWGGGNWSGSADAVLRTLRGGMCLRQAGGKPFLIYGYFSTATPSAMARSFQALDCDYGMLLDMNAIEHTYLAVYQRKDDQLRARHLVPGMALVDRKRRDGTRVPRFVGYPDNRDFFYLTQKEASE